VLFGNESLLFVLCPWFSAEVLRTVSPFDCELWKQSTKNVDSGTGMVQGEFLILDFGLTILDYVRFRRIMEVGRNASQPPLRGWFIPLLFSFSFGKQKRHENKQNDIRSGIPIEAGRPLPL
jgi:hypothetical protein